MNQTWKIIVAVILTAVVVGGGIFFLQQNSIKELREENATSLPNGIEWLTYSDNDVTFTYPKTFLGTSMQENFDQNLGSEQWEVTRQDNTIYIRPNFESPAAEFGATYEIKIIKDTWAAEEEWSTAAQLHQGPESQWGEKLVTQATNYYIGVLSDLDFGLGQIADVYTLVPGGIDGLGESQKPNEKHFVIYAHPDLYQSYIEDILIPSIQAK
ncbi:MAG: hypothetical protein ABIH78_04965 [Candidatus Peregrinibacteria bacterium]